MCININLPHKAENAGFIPGPSEPASDVELNHLLRPLIGSENLTGCVFREIIIICSPDVTGYVESVSTCRVRRSGSQPRICQTFFSPLLVVATVFIQSWIGEYVNVAPRYATSITGHVKSVA